MTQIQDTLWSSLLLFVCFNFFTDLYSLVCIYFSFNPFLSFSIYFSYSGLSLLTQMPQQICFCACPSFPTSLAGRMQHSSRGADASHPPSQWLTKSCPCCSEAPLYDNNSTFVKISAVKGRWLAERLCGIDPGGFWDRGNRGLELRVIFV